MRTRAFVSRLTVVGIVSALFSGVTVSVSPVAYAQTVSNEGQKTELTVPTLPYRSKAGSDCGRRISFGSNSEELRSCDAVPAAGMIDSDRATTYGWLSWGRKGVLFVLRHSTHKLPAKIRPWASKIANVLEDTEEWEKAPIIYALGKAGMPYDVAKAAADWIVFFLG
ncbi:hypothetical protein [Cutibacterium sp.]|uniref:hypothetical protein n=1 Tax=Cutibacterium sp. TaxID=1912221 RepID=UPI0026DB9896|nr:hypothetical protein [Cutibacterium sp.]MDO4412899.1 hypothetical protein [Cutibacterium sp.]